jgi:hypothetical protein
MTTHRHTINGKPSPTYRAYKNMLTRCEIPSTSYYHRYGGRGIKVCDRWRGRGGFLNFLADMGEKPINTELHRKNGDGNYEPGNCVWMDRHLHAVLSGTQHGAKYKGAGRPKKPVTGKFIQPGFKLEIGTWYLMKELALKKRRDAGSLMREAVSDYLRKHGKGE